MVRNRLVLALAAGAAGWVVVEIAFALHGWPGLPRYMFEAAALCAVLAGVFVGWALSAVSSLRVGLPRWAGVPVVIILAIALAPGALLARAHRAQGPQARARAARRTSTCSDRSSPSSAEPIHVRHCGQPAVEVAWVSALAWWLHMDVGFHPPPPQTRSTARARRSCSSPHPEAVGWSRRIHLRHHNAAVCSLLHARFEVMPGHPTGVFERLS